MTTSSTSETGARVLAGLIALLVWTGSSPSLSGPENEIAHQALKVAGQAVDGARRAGADQIAPEHFKDAETALLECQAACERADYVGCAKLADRAWALARLARQACRKRRTDKNRFAVSVDKKGLTRVTVLEGDGVKVTARKRSTTVRRGQTVRVSSGQTPGEVKKLPDPPEPVLPFEESVLITHSLHFHWKPAKEARQYVLTISRDAAGLTPVRQIISYRTTYLLRSNLPNGQYHWFVRSVNADNDVSGASVSRRFTLRVEIDSGVTFQPAQKPKGPPDGKEKP